MGTILHAQLTRVYLLVQFLLITIKESGNLGLHPNANSFYGWWRKRDVGLLTDWREEAWFTLPGALFVIKSQRPLTTCWCLVSFSRVGWYNILRKFGIHSLSPIQSDTNYMLWWKRVSTIVSGLNRKGLDSLLILGAWMVWKLRNRVVFDGVTPTISLLLESVHEEREKWQVAGARGLSFLAGSSTALGGL